MIYLLYISISRQYQVLNVVLIRAIFVSIAYFKGQQTFSAKGQLVNVLVFADHIVSVAITQA